MKRNVGNEVRRKRGINEEPEKQDGRYKGNEEI